MAFASAALADSTLCQAGSAAGQCLAPQGLATDFETGRLFVADQGNNRIDVFESDGTFVMAFGWGVNTGANKLQTCTTGSTCQAGIAGTGQGQFSAPTSIAVDNDPASASQHDLYVFDKNLRLQKLDPEGSYLLSLGSEGTGKCQFSTGGSGRSKDLVAVGPGGTVYVADSPRVGPGEFFVSRVETFDSAGACLGEVVLFEGTITLYSLAVDSSGDFYVTTEGVNGIRKYDSSGTLLYELDKGTQTSGLAVDSTDNLFAEQRVQQVTIKKTIHFITEYDSSGKRQLRFAYGSIRNFLPALAVSENAGGDVVFGGDQTFAEAVKSFTVPPLGPVIVPEPCQVKTGALGNTKATLQAEVNPEGKATTIHFEYVDRKSFEEEGGFASKETKETEGEAIGSDFELHEATGLAALSPETEYRCRVVATNADGSTKGEEGSFTSLEALEFGPTTVSGVGTEAATLNAVVNPLGIETKGFFEYVEEATYLKDIEELGPEHGFDDASKAPAEEELDFGATESLTLRSAQVSGLKPGTSYRFRVVATNPFAPLGLKGPTAYLHTYGAAAEPLPDDRAWELVSPGEKNSAEVAVPGNAGGFVEPRTLRIQAGAASGEAVTYTSFTSFGDAESAPATSQYLSKRTEDGWQTENISPGGFEGNPLRPPYSGFTPDLGFGALYVSEPPLTADCPQGFENFYLRDNETGTLRCLTPEIPNAQLGNTTCFVYAGASEDGDRVFFASTASYAGIPEVPGSISYSLYEWSLAEGLRPVSILPGQSEAATPTSGTSFGAAGNSFAGSENCQIGQTTLRHAVSADGRTTFWTYVPETGATQLLARVNGEETIQLDAKVPSGKGGDGKFLAASADGSLAFFTAPGKLNSEAQAAGQLYRYDTVERTLEDLTPGEVAPEVQGIAGVADDGSHLYFVAKGVLTGEEKGVAGQQAKAGADNLYLYREGEGLRFIATLASEDENDWESSPRFLTSRVSPDGRNLAFLSIEAKALVGYDNTIANGEHCKYEPSHNKLGAGPLCSQAFVYDADTNELTCASCNPSGARPLGPTLLPGWSNVYEGPRYLPDDGSRLFFESYDVLSLADQNGKRDVYEYERAGTGSCGVGSPAYDPLTDGCHFLISSGESSDDSFLIDASADGRDAFFSSRASLVGWDVNENYDVYDAREGGGFAEPPEQPIICLGKACRLPVEIPPPATSPATPNFRGAGNPVQTPVKHKHRKKGKHKKKHSKANQKRRNGR